MDDVKAQLRETLREAARARRTVTYQEVTARVGTDLPEGALPDLLREISTEESAAGRGMLTAVVVRASGSGAGMPGGGFFRLAADLGRDVSDRQACWQRELAHVYRVHDEV